MLQRKMVEENERREQQFLGMFDDVLSGMAAEPGGIMGETQYVVEHRSVGWVSVRSVGT